MASQGPKPMIIPFYAPLDTLPAPLPTVAEIFASTNLFPCIFEKRCICRIGEHFLVKYGRVKLDEAENMLFVAQQCGAKVLVPKLYAAFHDDHTGLNFIIMEHIQGKTLESLWESLGQNGRNLVAHRLKSSFRVLHQIPPQGYYGRLGARPYDDIFLGSSTLFCGPFLTEEELNHAFYRRYTSLHPTLASGRGEFYRDCVFPAVMRGHEPVFTHGDLQAKNILIRASDGMPVLIDWECAAWYPSYWEYTNALWTSRRWGDDWFRFLGGFLEQYVVEFKCMENLLSNLLDKPQPGV